MFDILMTIVIILIAIAIAVMLKLSASIDKLIEQEKEDEEQEKSNTKRVHSSVAQADFTNPLQGRGYDKYKNKDGLYEPVTGKAGINLNQAKGE